MSKFLTAIVSRQRIDDTDVIRFISPTRITSQHLDDRLVSARRRGTRRQSREFHFFLVFLFLLFLFFFLLLFLFCLALLLAIRFFGLIGRFLVLVFRCFLLVLFRFLAFLSLLT